MHQQIPPRVEDAERPQQVWLVVKCIQDPKGANSHGMAHARFDCGFVLRV